MKIFVVNFFLFLLFLFRSLNAQQATFEQQFHKAETFLEAKEYTQAREADQQILDREITPWQRSIVLYHLGMVDYAEGNWEEAIGRWRKIPLSKKSPPLLRFRIETALALAELQLDSTSLYHLNRSLNHLKEADEAYCAYQESRGAKRYPSSDEITAIRSSVKEAIDRILTNIKVSGDDIALLLSGVEELKEDLILLQTAQRSDYHALYLKRAVAWKPYMDRPSFDAVIAALEKGDYATAQQQLDQLQKELQDEVKKQLKVNGEQQAIVILLAEYQQALKQQPLQVSTVTRLIQSQKSIAKLKTDLLESSLDYLQKGKGDDARAYLLFAEYSVKKTQENEKKGPQEILEGAIAAQRTAFEMTQLSPEDRPLIHEMQMEVITTVAPFLKSSFLKQRHDFNRRCQIQPWKKVFPLFDEGYQQALRAGGKETEIEDVIASQENALRNWEEALRYLKMPPPVPKEQETASEDILRQLQEMEIQDLREKPEIRPSTSVEKPW